MALPNQLLDVLPRAEAPRLTSVVKLLRPLLHIGQQIVRRQLDHDHVGLGHIQCLVQVLRRQFIVMVRPEKDDIQERLLRAIFLLPPHPDVGDISLLTLIQQMEIDPPVQSKLTLCLTLYQLLEQVLPCVLQRRS